PTPTITPVSILAITTRRLAGVRRNVLVTVRCVHSPATAMTPMSKATKPSSGAGDRRNRGKVSGPSGGASPSPAVATANTANTMTRADAAATMTRGPRIVASFLSSTRTRVFIGGLLSLYGRGRGLRVIHGRHR